jgi:hypothetical protein
MIKNRKYHLIDLGIAVEHFCLRATEEGLGTCILGWFDEKPVKRLLKIPFWKRLHLIITVGYPASDAIREKAHKPLDEIRSFNTYRCYPPLDNEQIPNRKESSQTGVRHPFKSSISDSPLRRSRMLVRDPGSRG